MKKWIAVGVAVLILAVILFSLVGAQGNRAQAGEAAEQTPSPSPDMQLSAEEQETDALPEAELIDEPEDEPFVPLEIQEDYYVDTGEGSYGEAGG